MRPTLQLGNRSYSSSYIALASPRPGDTPSPGNGSTLDQQIPLYLGAINAENWVFKPTNLNGFHAAANSPAGRVPRSE